MGFIEFLSKLFGNKSQRDLKEIMPYVEKIQAVYPEIQQLSHDELRARTEAIKQRIADFVAPEKEQIAAHKASVEETPIEKREKIYREIDR